MVRELQVLPMRPHIQETCEKTAVLDTIGNTPLIHLERVGGRRPHVEVYGKAEWFNPGGSVKDRPALEMIEQGERTGKLKSGKILLDATSGNTGIAYAMIGAVRSIPVRLAMPENVTPERLKILEAYGADLVLTSGREGSDGAIRTARKMYSENQGRYFYPISMRTPPTGKLTTGARRSKSTSKPADASPIS